MIKRLILRLFLLLILITAAGGAWLFFSSERPFKGYEGSERFVEIPPGAGPSAIGRRLAEAGIVRDNLSFRVALWRTGHARRLQAGEYRFEGPLSARGV